MVRYASAFILASTLVSAEGLTERIEAVLAAGAASRAVWGINVVELSSGRVLYEHNSATPLTPASNMKLLTTALALKTFGSSHRFQTKVIESSRGDLILLGGADPTLSGRIYPYVREGTMDPTTVMQALAAQAAGAGVKRVRGDLVGDDSLHEYEPWPDGWATGDVPWEYGAAVSALTYNDNAASLSIRPGREPGDVARIILKPPLPWLTIHNTLRTEKGVKREIRVDRLPGSTVLTISGEAPPGSGAASQLISVDDPALFASEALRDALAEQGIAVRGTVRARHRAPGEKYCEPEGRVVAQRLSPPLEEIIAVVNKVSQNLHAELLLREIGRVRTGKASRAAGTDELESWLASLGVPKEEFALADGSGLSRPVLISPKAVTTVLSAMSASPEGETFWRSLPIAGIDGTLTTRFRVTGIDASPIRGKTGSIRHVAALSGYVGLDPATRVAFSIIANHATAPSQEIRAAIDRIGIAIMESSHY